MKNKKIEVEGGELAIRSKEGTIAIIPAKDRQYIMDNIGCDDCINSYIQKLPTLSDYAQNGGVISFKEAFADARKNLGSNNIFEWNGKIYNTNIVGEKFTPSKEIVKQYKLKMDDIDRQNKLVESPFTSKEQVKIQNTGVWKDWSDIKLRSSELNNMSEADKIINFHKGKEGRYVIIDKGDNKRVPRLHYYKNGELFKSYEVGVGKHIGDEQTKTVIKDGKPDWDSGNLQSGAGIWKISNINELYGEPSFNLSNEQGVEQPMTLHRAPSKRLHKFNDGDVSNNRMSYGCINGICGTMQELYDDGLTIGDMVYVLPENVNNGFTVNSDRISFYSDNPNVNRSVSGDYSRDKIKDYQEKLVKKGYLKNEINGVNQIDGIWGKNTQKAYESAISEGFDPIKESVKNRILPIQTEIDKENFKKDIFTLLDFNDEKEFKTVVQPFIKTLSDKKADVIKETGISNDEYNDIAKLTFGILGNETNFGDTHTAGGNFLRAVRKYMNSNSSSPDYKSKYETYDVTEDNNSVGLTQFRWKWVEKDKEQGGNLKEILNRLGINSNKDFMEPEKAAVGTAAVLSYYYKTRSMKPSDIFTKLAGHWGGSSNDKSIYINNAFNNSKYLNIKQLVE